MPRPSAGALSHPRQFLSILHYIYERQKGRKEFLPYRKRTSMEPGEGERTSSYDSASPTRRKINKEKSEERRGKRGSGGFAAQPV
jgi:hypothetical protein